MKKSIIPVLLILSTVWGCNRHSDENKDKMRGDMDGHRAQPSSTSSMYKNAAPATTIMPGAANNAPPLTVMIPANASQGATISGYFIGPTPPVVAINGDTVFNNVPAKLWNSVSFPPIPIRQRLMISPSLTEGIVGGNYTTVINSPYQNSVDSTGVNLSVYSDTKGDTAIIVVQDGSVVALR